jgi:CheY-like chemotaxis protein/tetratricopeptide (TPR) repeat protein
MDLESDLATLKNQSLDLPPSRRAELSCRVAKHFEKTGEYEAAREALIEFWPARDQEPKLEGLEDAVKADVLLRVGALAGWLGQTNQMVGGQETAKDLITQSLDLFEKISRTEKAAEAHGDLALCYWREGSYDEARIHLTNALDVVGDQNHELKAILLIRAGIVEVWAQRLNEALRFYDEAIPFVEQTQDHALKGSFHFEYGLVLRRLSAPENREDYLDRALIEYAASGFHYEQAGNVHALARVELNLGYLFYTIQRYKEAHRHLDNARHLFLKLKDRGTAAQVDDTRARTLLAEGHIVEAERIARNAVRVLERGDQQALLAEALTTQGVALARLGNDSRARALLERAIDVAQTTGDLEGAGRAKLSIIEDLEERTPAKELISIYRSAIDLLKRSQDPATGKRLIACAERLFETFGRLDTAAQDAQARDWDGFSFKRHVREGERAVIEQALRDAGGSVTKAARLLGLRHHQSLISLINSRHRELLTARSNVRKRRRHLFSKSKKNKKNELDASLHKESSEISILHVEDNEAVARTVADILKNEGMDVDSCLNGSTALKILKGKTHYDAIIVDNGLPGLSGLELVKRVRNISHRHAVPIIMLSADNLEMEAWRAGVDEFLLKPEAIDKVSSTITRFLRERKEPTD